MTEGQRRSGDGAGQHQPAGQSRPRPGNLQAPSAGGSSAATRAADSLRDPKGGSGIAGSGQAALAVPRGVPVVARHSFIKRQLRMPNAKVAAMRSRACDDSSDGHSG